MAGQLDTPKKKRFYHFATIPISVAMGVPAQPLVYVEAYVWYGNKDGGGIEQKGVGSSTYPVIALRTTANKRFSKSDTEEYPWDGYHTAQEFTSHYWTQDGYETETEFLILEDGRIVTERDIRIEAEGSVEAHEYENTVVPESHVERARKKLEEKLAAQHQLPIERGEQS